ncbi:MAG: hypothetical protein IKS18_08390 [Lachnospiraceae bacterium]|nr:hypothetical protein [Lachnospiraceae bacterium]
MRKKRKNKLIKYIVVIALAVFVVGGTILSTRIIKQSRGLDRTKEESSKTAESPAETVLTDTSVSSDETTAEVTEVPTTDFAAEESPEEISEETVSEASEETETSSPAVVLRDPDAVIDTSTTLYTYDKMQEDLQYLAAVYPDLVQLHSAGTTEDGRDLSYVIFGNPEAERQIYICAATHGREYMTPQLVMRQLAFYCTEYESGSYNGMPFSEIFQRTCFYVEPMVNPDGVTISQLGEEGLFRQDLRENLRKIFESDLTNGTAETADYAAYLVRWKANALGVDINRNYSPGWESVQERAAPSSTFYKGTAPGSERETQAQIAIIESMSNPLMAISYHSYGDLVYWQYGQPEPLWSENQALAQHISNMTGQYLAGYSNEAGFSNWCIIEKQLKSVTVETGTVPAPLPLSQFAELWEEHRYIWAMLATVY